MERRTGAFRSCKRIDCGFSVSPEKGFFSDAISNRRLGVLPKPTPASGTAASPPVAPPPLQLLSMTPLPTVALIIRADGVRLALRDTFVPKLFSIS